MKISIWIFCLTLAISVPFPFEKSVHAVLNISGKVVQDSNTGLEWLVMSETVNKSPDRIMAGDYGLKAAGWTHATIAQIETLFLNAGMTGPFNGNGNSNQTWQFDAANHLIALLGYTQEACGLGCTYVISAFSAVPGTSPGSLYEPSIMVTYVHTGSAVVPGPSVPSNTASPTIGNWLVRANPAISPPVFDSKSAILTNAYVSMIVGDKLTYKSYGYPFTFYSYTEALKHETIDQVRCLKIRESDSDSSTAIYYYWLAQDKSGNVWILQYQDVESNDLRYYGRNYAKIFMPSTVTVGSALWDPEAIETVVASGITVPSGPYYNCLKSKAIDYVYGEPESGSDIYYLYYAPGVGLVKVEIKIDGGIYGLEISAITRESNRSKSMPWLQLLLID